MNLIKFKFQFKIKFQFKDVFKFHDVLIKVSRLLFGDFIFKFHDDKVVT